MIKFYRGLKNRYDKSNHGSGIYFATDTLEIIHDGSSYSGLVEVGKTVTDVSLVDGKLTITYSDNTTSEVEIGSGKYSSAITDKQLEMPNAVGGIAKGTKLETLEGKSYNAILDDLLFPTVTPTYVAPSASLALKNYDAIQEVGLLAPTSNNFTVGYNAGAINLNGVKQNNRGGDHNESISSIYYGGVVTNTTLPTRVIEGNMSYTYRAVYTQGPQPKDNKGNDYQTPLASGSVDSSPVVVNGTYPWFATTSAPGTLTKQPLIAWNSTVGSMVAGGTVGFDLLPHTATARQQFKLPRQATSLEMYNTVAKAFEVVALSEWAVATSEDEINGVNCTYYTYTYTGANRGSVKLIVKF